MNTYDFVISDGNAAASRGRAPDRYSHERVEAENLNDAIIKIWEAVHGDTFEDYFRDWFLVDNLSDLEGEDKEELEGIKKDPLGFIDGEDIGGGAPWIECIQENGEYIRESYVGEY